MLDTHCTKRLHLEGWAGVNCDRCADNWYPLGWWRWMSRGFSADSAVRGSCNVYCTFEETCSYHGRSSSKESWEGSLSVSMAGAIPMAFACVMMAG